MTSMRRGNQLPWDSHSQLQMALKPMETTHSSPKFQPEGHMASTQTYQGRKRRDKWEATEKMHQRRHWHSPHQSRDGPKGVEAHGGPMSGHRISPLCPPTPMELWPMANSSQQKKSSKSSRIKPCTCPDVSHYLLSNQSNYDWPCNAHWENNDRLD